MYDIIVGSFLIVGCGDEDFTTKRPNTSEFKNKHGIYDIYIDCGEQEVSFVNVYEDGTPVSPSVMKHASRIIHGYSSYLNSPNK